MEISVVIRTFTQARWDLFVAAVESVQQQTLPPGQIVVVVDNNPALLERAASQFPKITVVDNHQPRGSSGALTSGAMAAQSEVVAFLDDDAIAAPDWLERLSEGYEKTDVVGVGGTTLLVWESGRPRWYPQEFFWIVGGSYKGIPEEMTPIRNFFAGNMSFRREVFEAIGGFRRGMGHMGRNPIGCDETELCIRLHQHWPDKILLHAPLAVIHHYVPDGKSTLYYFLRRCYLEGRSKAMISWLVGFKDGMANERVHAFQTIPKGVINNLKDAILHGDIGGLTRAAAIVAGLLMAAGGYAIGILFWLVRPRSHPEEFGQIPVINPPSEI